MYTKKEDCTFVPLLCNNPNSLVVCFDNSITQKVIVRVGLMLEDFCPHSQQHNTSHKCNCEHCIFYNFASFHDYLTIKE